MSVEDRIMDLLRVKPRTAEQLHRVSGLWLVPFYRMMSGLERDEIVRSWYEGKTTQRVRWYGKGRLA